MNASSAFLAIRWLVRDTFRQARASRISWLMLIVTVMAIFFCLGVGISGDMKQPNLQQGYLPEKIPLNVAKTLDPKTVADSEVYVIKGDMTLLFGTVRVPLSRTRDEAVRQLQLILVSGVADTAGLLLALIWTAGFLPSFLEPASATVLLVKPAPRWSILTGKFLGVILFVMVQATFFVVGTWLALGLKTAVWEPLYLFCIPLLIVHFAIFFSFSTLLAVWTRNAVACIFGTILFWLLCWGMNYGHHAALARQIESANLGVKPGALLLKTAGGKAPPPGERDVPAQVLPAMLFVANPHAGFPAGVPWANFELISQWDIGRPPTTTPTSSVLMEIGYWLMPKPADMGIILFNSLQADNMFAELSEYKTLHDHHAFHFELSVLSSLGFMVVVLGLAVYEFVHTDY